MRWIALAFVALMAALWLNACGGPTPLSDQPPAAGRQIEHAMGTTQVPDSPQRVITLDYSALEGVLALGLTPVGTVLNGGLTAQPPHLQPYLSGVETIGSPTQPNLEKILALKPDLILGSRAWAEGVYSALTPIAPTVFTADINENWKTDFQFYAEALNRPEQAAAAMAAYQQRLDEIRQPLRPLTVSVVRVLPGSLRLYLKTSFIGQIIADVGLSRPPAQDKALYSQEISQEQLALADGDVIFAMTIGSDEVDALAELMDTPLWQQLQAVRNDRLYPVGDHWLGPGLLSAQAVLDDLAEKLP
ncbi:MAG: iron-siderophore ABC transporter substrate-binding protein [Kaiparowitsia implicata GSE-PSE-MK54-09C]|nr:iron-siderophore ABC transporter substrate-binding protein [Kaiparowitsia implicata GSE-PSE-MK54-09C]